jgi:hypothetical protein
MFKIPSLRSPQSRRFASLCSSRPDRFVQLGTPCLWRGVRRIAVILALSGLNALAQIAADVSLFKTDVYTQVSSAYAGFSSANISVIVSFQYGADPESTTVRLRKPDGRFVPLTSAGRGFVYSLDESFLTLAQRSATYPDGAYSIVITGGGRELRIPVIVSSDAITSPIVRNVGDLSAITGPTVEINWTPIPKEGDEEERLSWRLMDMNGELLQRRDIPDPRQSSYTVHDFPIDKPAVGILDYFRQTTSLPDVSTRVTVGSGVSVWFPMHRGPSVPQPPAAFGGFASSASAATLSWQIVPGSDEQTGYRLERSTSRDFPSQETTVFLIAGSQTSFTDTSIASAPASYYYRIMALNDRGASLPSSTAEINLLGPVGTGAPPRFINIASRAYCSRGTNVTIGGFVVGGRQSKRVLIRAVGPTLATRGISSEQALKDPAITLLKGQSVVATNDDWGSNSNVAEMIGIFPAIGAFPLDATDTKSAALLVDLEPGVYSFVVSGKADTEGIVLLEVYDADGSVDAHFANIATRAYSTTGDGVTIGGFVIHGRETKRVLVRAIGPGLTAQGIATHEVLIDPVIEVYRGGTIIATNDNWKTNESSTEIVAQGKRIGAAPILESDDRSSALLLRLPAGVYSFVAYGRNSSGIVLVEVYDAD